MFDPSPDIYSVKTLVGELRGLMESNYRQILVEGEISGLARPASGHLYFSLKEGNALIRCAFFRNRRIGSSDPEEGMQVQVRGQISVYESRGDLQLIVSRLQPAGQGALQRAFELLKKKLMSEGLFDAAHKQALPVVPSAIGVVTSTTGAAMHDILVTLRRRFPAAHVIVYPTLVQGEQAEAALCGAISTAGQRQEVDVLLVARGGGALEDLQAFNTESVARAIFNCAIPVVSGVGHETDFTIADMVADHRAATPTAAAELVTPDRLKLLRETRQHYQRLKDAMARYLDRNRQTVDYTSARLVHPTQRLRQYRQQQQHLGEALLSLIRLTLLQHARKLERKQLLLATFNPANAVLRMRQQVSTNRNTVLRQVSWKLKRCAVDLVHKQAQLSLVSPMQTLDRGYSILQNDKGDVISKTAQMQPGQIITARLHDGRAQLQVDKVSTITPEPSSSS